MPQVIPIELPTGYPGEGNVIIYVVKTSRQTVLIDTSTFYQNNSELLKIALDKAGVDHLDKVLLTHCHGDHSGNAKTVKGWFPDAEVMIHHLGAQRLRQGNWFDKMKDQRSRFFTNFGYPSTDPESFFRFRTSGEKPQTLAMNPDTEIHEDARLDDFEIFVTPGHSLDHVCYGVEDHIFCGDTVLEFVPGMEDIWLGHSRTFIDYLESCKKLEQLSDRFPHVHAFHGNSIPSLKQWYHQIIAPRIHQKYLKLVSVLSPDQPQTLCEMMQILHPKLPRHYIYITQYMGLLILLEQEGLVSRTENETGFWYFLQTQPMNPDFLRDYMQT
ncbi:MAG: MBL fold metallo-hydrolase [SAR324 cluster bacterium]|nr:MBL fold metallo-hydrolase [SAR324 cluster bacterium]